MAVARPWWLAFGAVTVVAATTGINSLETEQRGFLLPGTTSHGHYQIELSCESCHTPFLGDMQEACMGCHGEELELVDDSHPAKKFRDPRNADRLQKIDAMRCVTCHVEHEPDATLPMGLTQPRDFCFHCHSDIGDERETHAGLGFETCQNESCHNFHDNRALNEDFLAAHLDEPALFDEPLVASWAPSAAQEADAGTPGDERSAPDALPEYLQDEALVGEWQASAHAVADVNCSDCHGGGEGGEAEAFVSQPQRDVCEDCHDGQVATFEQGKHGMRLAAGLSPMTPRRARLPMRADAATRALGCTSCHGAHAFDRQQASVDACLACHADQHSQAYKQGPHFLRWQAELDGTAARGSGVSCATCHMPRAEGGDGLHVMHNQNDNLRPVEKMVRPVCGKCHGVEFSLAALMDPELIERNFDRSPSMAVDGLEWVRKRAGQL